MLIAGGFPSNTKIGVEFDVDNDVQKLLNSFLIAEKFLDDYLTLNEVRPYFYYDFIDLSYINYILGIYYSKN